MARIEILLNLLESKRNHHGLGVQVLESFLTALNWIMLIASGWGFFQSLYNEQWIRSAISGFLLTVFVYSMFFMH